MATREFKPLKIPVMSLFMLLFVIADILITVSLIWRCVDYPEMPFLLTLPQNNFLNIWAVKATAVGCVLSRFLMLGLAVHYFSWTGAGILFLCSPIAANIVKGAFDYWWEMALGWPLGLFILVGAIAIR